MNKCLDSRCTDEATNDGWCVVHAAIEPYGCKRCGNQARSEEHRPFCPICHEALYGQPNPDMPAPSACLQVLRILAGNLTVSKMRKLGTDQIRYAALWAGNELARLKAQRDMVRVEVIREIRQTSIKAGTCGVNDPAMAAGFNLASEHTLELLALKLEGLQADAGARLEQIRKEAKALRA